MDLHFSDLNAFILTCLLIYFLKNFAPKVGLVDQPSGRKDHQGEVPLVGGIAVFISFLLSVLAAGAGEPYAAALCVGGAILMLEGVLDDRFGFIAPPRFLAQAAAAAAMIFISGAVVHDLGALAFSHRQVALGVMAIPFTIFATIGVINAFNMADGMDGLLGSLALVSLVALGLVAGLGDRVVIFKLIVLLSSAIAAFLIFNLRTPWRSHAYVFLGDAGSTFVGFAITWFVIKLSQGSVRSMPPTVGLWLLMVPLYDTVYVMCRRAAQGRSPLSADRKHLHHLLLDLGFSVNQTLLWIVGLALSGVAVGLGGMALHVHERILFATFLGAFVVYSVSISLLWFKSMSSDKPVDSSHQGEPHRFPQRQNINA